MFLLSCTLFVPYCFFSSAKSPRGKSVTLRSHLNGTVPTTLWRITCASLRSFKIKVVRVYKSNYWKDLFEWGHIRRRTGSLWAVEGSRMVEELKHDAANNIWVASALTKTQRRSQSNSRTTACSVESDTVFVSETSLRATGKLLIYPLGSFQDVVKQCM